MNSKIEKWRMQSDKFYNNVTREELIQLLIDAGFTVKDDTDRILDEDENDITDEYIGSDNSGKESNL